MRSCALLCTLTVALAGCGPREQNAPTPPAPAPQVLRIGISTDVDNWSLDRFPDGDGRFVWAQVYGTLVRLTPDLTLTEGLATSWEAEDGGTSWVFTLREGVTFHDGTPFDADAVRFSYGPDSYAARTVLRPLQHVEVIDDHTVRFILKRPVPLPYYLTHIGWPVMSPSCIDADGSFTKPIGTGPWMFESQKTEQEAVLARNDDCWRGGPDVDRVVVKVIPEAAARVIALEAGELDMILKVPEADVARLHRAPHIQVHRTTSTFTDFIQFNCERPPLSDVRVRQAVASAVDTQTLSARTLEGVGTPACGSPLAPVMLYRKPDLDLVEFDPGRSRRLLSQAGWDEMAEDGIRVRDGERLTALMLVNPAANVASGSRFQLIAEAVQAHLRDVGMELTIRLLERGAFLSAEAAGEFDMLLRTGFYVWGPYPRHFFLHFSGNEYSHYANPEYDDLITRADAAPDEDTRRQLFHRLQEETLRRMPAFYMVHQEKIVATRDSVAGYRISSEPPWLNLDGVSVAPQ